MILCHNTWRTFCALNEEDKFFRANIMPQALLNGNYTKSKPMVILRANTQPLKSDQCWSANVGLLEMVGGKKRAVIKHPTLHSLRIMLLDDQKMLLDMGCIEIKLLDSQLFRYILKVFKQDVFVRLRKTLCVCVIWSLMAFPTFSFSMSTSHAEQL